MLNQTVKLTVDFLGVLMFTENGARNYIFLSDVSGKIPLIVRWVLCPHGHEYTIYYIRLRVFAQLIMVLSSLYYRENRRIKGKLEVCLAIKESRGI